MTVPVAITGRVRKMRLTAAAAVCTYAAGHCPDLSPDEVFGMLSALGDVSVSEMISALAKLQHERRPT